MKLPPPIISDPIEEYGGLSEVISVEELNEKYSDLANTSIQVKLAYQCLIIRERCLGYGEFTVISSLFMYGGWMIVLDHFPEGLSLWLRGTQMLLSHFEEGIRSKHELIRLIKNGYYCIKPGIGKLIKVFQTLQDLSTKFELIVCNLIECQRQSMEMIVNNKEVTIYSGSDCIVALCNWIDCFRLLDGLSQNSFHTIDVTSLCHQLIKKCPEFRIRPTWHANALDIIRLRHRGRTLSACFLSLLLQSGGNAFVNKVGVTGYRPLNLVQTKEATSLLLAHGAHLDAVSKPVSPDRKYILFFPIELNPFLLLYLSLVSPQDPLCLNRYLISH